ncbi:MAG: hypothetical protein R3A46_13180 [Thermomicrobiales bacterium]
MSISPVLDPENEVAEPRPLIGAIDVDAAALAMPSVTLVDRLISALSYLSVFSVIVIATRPSTRFMQRHVQIAISIFVIRSLWMSGIVAAWWWTAEPIAGEGKLQPAIIDVASAITIGAPLSDTWSTGALPWLLTPAIFTLGASIAGLLLAITGRSADFQAFVSADWSDPVLKRSYLGMSPEDERTLARRARERQIERLQKSSRMLRTEQARRLRIADIESQLERIELQREYHDQLLALGEISQRRYEQVNAELDEQAAQLRGQLSSLETRIQNADEAGRESSDGSRLRRPAETLIESLAIVTPDGVPIFTYGQFQLDDAIVAGMLSAFDSLSEEVFGSRVSKTSLAEGQVLYFAHGDYVLIMASFIDEPSPRQIEDLRKMLKGFESANEGPIARKQYDPQYLHEVPVPFRFAERMPRSSAGLSSSE